MKYLLKNPLYLNLILGIFILILSFYTLHWHNQSRLFFKQLKVEQNKNHTLTAFNKNLIIQRSLQIDKGRTRTKSFKNLDMHKPKKTKVLSI